MSILRQPRSGHVLPHSEAEASALSTHHLGECPRVRVLLVNPPGDILDDEHLEPPLGLLSIASYVQEKLRIRPTILDLTGYSIEEAERTLCEHRADVIGFSVYCTKWEITKSLISAVLRDQRPMIIVGGPNATALPKETLCFDPVNVVICGEGEKAFCGVLEDVQARRLDTSCKRIVHGERLAAGEFPMPDRSLVEELDTYHRRCFDRPVVNLEASRGCRNNCIFCNSVVMGGGCCGGVVAKDPELVVREINTCIAQGYRVFRFNDDSFVYAALSSGLLERLSDMDVQYRAFANAKDLSANAVSSLKDSGCFHLSVGVESYNPENLRIVGKQTSREQIRDGINRAADAGIKVRAYFIVGLPCDCSVNVRYYMKRVAAEVRFHEYCIYPLIPYPGTQIWHHPGRFGYRITSRDFNSYVQIGKQRRSTFVLRHRNFDETDVDEWLHATDSIFVAHGKLHSHYSKVV